MTTTPRRNDWMLYAGAGTLAILLALLASGIGGLPRLLGGLLGVGLVIFSLWKREKDRDRPSRREQEGAVESQQVVGGLFVLGTIAVMVFFLVNSGA